MNNHVIRYAVIMLAGTVMNFALYAVAHIFHLPVWMDTVGTAYVAMALEPAAGLIIGLVTNFFLSAVMYGVSSLIYYLITAIAALSFGILLRRHQKISLRRLPLAIAVFIVFGSLFSALFTIWIDGGVSTSAWERFFCDRALSAGAPQFLACFFGAFILKCFDGLAFLLILPISYFLTPKSFITENLNEKLSWK